MTRAKAVPDPGRGDRPDRTAPLADGTRRGGSIPRFSDARRVREQLVRSSPYPLFVNSEWEASFPDLVAGITAAGPEVDFGLTTGGSAWRVSERYDRLAAQLGVTAVVVVRQVHGASVVVVGAPYVPGFCVAGRGDGLVATASGVLLVVTAADCVPVYMLDVETRALGLLHAGWRGVAAGVVESGIEALVAASGSPPSHLRVHLGPAICGQCYEVGPEVLAALGVPSGAAVAARVDLREMLARRAVSAGVTPERVTCSAWCTRCTADQFHSHRGTGGSAGRMAAYLGWGTGPGVAGGGPLR